MSQGEEHRGGQGKLAGQNFVRRGKWTGGKGGELAQGGDAGRANCAGKEGKPPSKKGGRSGRGGGNFFAKKKKKKPSPPFRPGSLEKKTLKKREPVNR